MTDEQIVKKIMQLAREAPRLSNGEKLKDGEISAVVRQLEVTSPSIRNVFFNGATVTEAHVEEAISKLETQFSIIMDSGTILKEDNHESWYYSAQAARGTDFWDRYEEYLTRTQNLPRKVIQNIDKASTEMMDALGDPQSGREFHRKGLVIGAVQSGKTSNYIALINKAADSGYKVFILLTGMVEKLRAQTQERVDAGFVGVDSKSANDDHRFGNNSQFVGVGKINPALWVDSFTNTEQDFSDPTHTMHLDDESAPIVFVIKKNVHVLEKLRTWLARQVVKTKSNKVDLPLLLIDDEADNASVNTSKPDKDPTAINSEIRKMLKLFTRFSYVGFTATPFANIFIDPQFDENGNAVEADQDDLFPKDFIYLLEQPSNYVGPVGMYRDEGNYHYMLRYNDDMENLLPLTHKKNARLTKLPDSLTTAVDLFFLSNAIRDLRGQEKKHRSMLIHVSRFIDVQESVEALVSDYVYEKRNEIKNFALDNEEKSAYMIHLHELFDREYGAGPNPVYGHHQFDKALPNVPESWEDVKQTLYKAIVPIQTHTINSQDNGNTAQRLDYGNYPDGLRLIAIGGLSLARGLTLEGLTISYFYRNTKMYDTLMQMGRWFGYRDNYADLCRLWTSKESANWYALISIATEDLRAQIRQMAQLHKRPIEFGLRVRSADETPLIVTARNKMSNTEKILMQRQLNGQVTETPIIFSDLAKIEHNDEIAQGWLRENNEYRVLDESVLGVKKPTFRDVPKASVLKLLDSLDFPIFNAIYPGSEFVREIEHRKSPVLDQWDVVIASNDAPKLGDEVCEFGGVDIVPVQRSFDYPDIEGCIRFSGTKKRLSNISYAKAGMDVTTYNATVESVEQSLKGELNAKGNQKRASETSYFNTGIPRNPLLVIFPVQLKHADDPDAPENQLVDQLERRQRLVCGISVGIPDTKGAEKMNYTYTINKVAQMKRITSSWNPNDEGDDDGVND
ncbi:Z1 domain-containing protein [Lacticaseibacillus nasuensis]|uniref:Z1 domain-containing protein n=1 Tax=Lacticaseibacillus nasuensis TaxID=944671 RepID=UPI002248277B|nr:Z1 domain-containing protein [Lacticaseibacillus nasuensis]MCX2456316.1 Z1 domain-containing protein [Lacticaseibacillus nasuensis]